MKYVLLQDSIDTGKIFMNSKEISAIRAIARQALMEDIRKNRDKYTTWLILAMEHVKQQGYSNLNFQIQYR
jgi:isopentenyldiphosphate isomerase